MLTSQWAISLQTPPYSSPTYSTLATCSDTTMSYGHHLLTNQILEVIKLKKREEDRERERERGEGGREREREGGRGYIYILCFWYFLWCTNPQIINVEIVKKKEEVHV